MANDLQGPGGPAGDQLGADVDGADLLAQDDALFQATWRAMPVEKRSALSDAVRARCIDRFRKLTSYIDTSIERFSRSNQSAPSGRPVIDLVPGEIAKAVNAGIEALHSADIPIFDRGGTLVRPIRIISAERSGGIARAAGAVVLRSVTPTWLHHTLAGVATWRRYDARNRDWRSVDPPERIANIIADAPDIGRWRPLVSVVRAPIVMHDGRIISRPGYDAASAMLADWDHDWDIPIAPTQDDARDALERLSELLRNYTFTDGVDEAVAISTFITAVERPALPAAPAHGNTSPEPGSGKSLMIDAASLIATGAHASVMDWGNDATESAKRIDAMMLAGDPIIAIDNVERAVEGAALCQLLSQKVRRIRPLGASAVVTAPCTAMVTVTGCNVVLRGDVVRRFVMCRIDAGVERPELRKIDQDLLVEVTDRRRTLVADILAIVGAYAHAGWPDVGLAPLGGYAEWSRMVRSAIVWAGGADPCRSMARLRDDDPARGLMRSVFHVWSSSAGNDLVTAADLIERAREDSALRGALTLIALRRGHLDARALGTWARYHRDRRIDGLRLVAAGMTRDGVQRWQVVKETTT